VTVGPVLAVSGEKILSLRTAERRRVPSGGMSDDTRMTRHTNAPAVQRVHDAWAMRIRGAGWEEIARVLGYANPQKRHAGGTELRRAPAPAKRT